MIHIILLILKIVGLILLILLGLLLLAVSLILFAPFRYKAEGKKYENLEGKASLTWLLHFLSVTAVYEDGIKISVRVLGFPQGEKKDKKKKGNPRRKRGAKAPEPDVHIASIEEQSEDFEYEKEDSGEDDKTEFPSQPERAEEEKESPPQPEGNPKAGNKNRKRRKNIFSKLGELLKGLKKKIFTFFSRLKLAGRLFLRKWRRIEDKAAAIRDFISDRENQEAFRLAFRQLKALCRHVFPRKIKGQLRIGFEDPYATGQAMAVAGLLCPLYKDSILIIPSFEEPALEGELKFKGRVQLFFLAVFLGKLFLNKRLRYLLKKMMR